MTILQEPALKPLKPRKQARSRALLAGECFHMDESVKIRLRPHGVSVPRLARSFVRRKKFINRVVAVEFPGRIQMPLMA